MAATFKWSAGAPTVRGLTSTEDMVVSIEELPYNIGGGIVSQTVKDIDYQMVDGGTTDNNFRVAVADSPVMPGASLHVSPESAGACKIDASGLVTRISDGECAVIVNAKSGVRRVSRFMKRAAGSPYPVGVNSFLAGSLRKYLRDQQIAALSGVTPGSASQRAHVYQNNIAAGNGETVAMNGVFGPVNPDNFLRAQTKPGFDPLPIDLLDSALATAGATIESRVWLSAHHYITGLGGKHGLNAGPSYRLIASDGVIRYSVTAWGGAIAKLLPSDWRLYLPAPRSGLSTIAVGIPAWARMFNTYIGGSSDPDAERRWVMPVSFGNGPLSLPVGDPLEPFQRHGWSSTNPRLIATGGDSGSPVFIGIAGQLVILSHISMFMNAFYDSYADHIPAINTAMNELATYYGDAAAGTYAAQTVNLSSFNTYP